MKTIIWIMVLGSLLWADSKTTWDKIRHPMTQESFWENWKRKLKSSDVHSLRDSLARVEVDSFKNLPTFEQLELLIALYKGCDKSSLPYIRKHHKNDPDKWVSSGLYKEFGSHKGLGGLKGVCTTYSRLVQSANKNTQRYLTVFIYLYKKGTAHWIEMVDGKWYFVNGKNPEKKYKLSGQD